MHKLKTMVNLKPGTGTGSPEEIKKTLENIQNKVDGLASGSPLVASNTSEMTDKSRVYVNTADGHWYYFDESWKDGGVYQGVELEDNSVVEEKTSFYKLNANKFLVKNICEKGYNIKYDYNTGITSISGTVTGTGGVEVSRFTINETTTFKYIRTALTKLNSHVRIFNVNDLANPVCVMGGNVTEGEYELQAGTYAIYIQASLNTILNEQSRYYLIPVDIYNSQNIITKTNLYIPSYFNPHINEINQDLYPFKELLVAQLIGDSFFVGNLDLINNKITINENTCFIYSYNLRNKKHTSYTKMNLINSNFVGTIDLINKNYQNDLYYVCLDYKGVLHSIPSTLFLKQNDNYFILCIFMLKESKIVSYNTFNNKFKVISSTSTEKDLSNLTLCCIGDSMTLPSPTGSNALNPTYPEMVKNILGLASVTNCGLSGSTIANNTVSSSTPMSDDARMASYPNADIIVVAGGYNDWGNNVPLGNFGTNDDTTFIGGYQKLMKYLIENNPSSLIIVMTTPMANGVPTSKNNLSLTKLDYINAIKDISRYYSVPLLNMNQDGQLGFYNKSTWTNDGLHFKQEYVNKIYAPRIAKFIKDLLS